MGALLDDLPAPALAAPLLLLASTGIGWWMRERLPDHHREFAVVEAARVMTTLLVTFAAVVLGLLTTSVKAHYDAHAANLQSYAIDLIELDQRMREYGPDADRLRATLRAYTAAAVADTWPDEPRPSGDYPTHLGRAVAGSLESRVLGRMLLDMDREIDRLAPATPPQRELVGVLERLMESALRQRWALVESARPTISWPFLSLILALLMLVFTLFGLTSPRNRLILVTVLLCAVAVSLILFLILDIDTPTTGPIRIASTPMREALSHMDE